MARSRLVGLILALFSLLAYLPVARHGFQVYDDPEYITENRMVQGGLTAAGLRWAFTSFHASNWHPVTWLSHMLDCELFGLDAGAHHLVNVLFHAANTGLLFFLLIRLKLALWPSAWVAALFSCHPLHVESVAWAAERKDLLSAFLGLLTIWAWFRYLEAAARPSRDTRRAWPRYVLALGLFAFGLMAKPMLVTLPFVLILIDYWPLRRLAASPCLPVAVFPNAPSAPLTLWRAVAEKTPFFILALGSCVITFMAQRAEAVIAMEPYPLRLRWENAVVAYGAYLLKTVWPVDLAVFYPLRDRVPAIQIVVALVGLAALSWVAWRNRRQRPYLFVGWLGFLGTLVPVIGLVQVGGQAMADRYTYLPLIGIFAAVAFEAESQTKRHRASPGVVAAVAGLPLAACLLLTEHQLGYWRDSQALFGHAVAVTRDNAVAHVNLGVAFEREGRREAALREYETALRLNPDMAQAHNNAGNLLDECGRLAEAEGHLREAVRLKPTAPLSHDNLGTLLVELGRHDEAMSQYAEALRLRPDDPRPHYLMGKALLLRGRGAEAVSQFRDALHINPDDVQSLAFLARVLSAENEASLRNGPAAVALAERANALTSGGHPFVLDTLAMAYAEAGRFADAQETARKALDLASAAGDQSAAAEMRQRLGFYQSNQPCRLSFTNPPPKASTR